VFHIKIKGKRETPDTSFMSKIQVMSYFCTPFLFFTFFFSIIGILLANYSIYEDLVGKIDMQNIGDFTKALSEKKRVKKINPFNLLLCSILYRRPYVIFRSYSWFLCCCTKYLLRSRTNFYYIRIHYFSAL